MVPSSEILHCEFIVVVVVVWSLYAIIVVVAWSFLNFVVVIVDLVISTKTQKIDNFYMA